MKSLKELLKGVNKSYVLRHRKYTVFEKKKKIGKEEKKFVKSVDKEKIVDSQSTVWKLRKFFLTLF